MQSAKRQSNASPKSHRALRVFVMKKILCALCASVVNQNSLCPLRLCGESKFSAPSVPQRRIQNPAIPRPPARRPLQNPQKAGDFSGRLRGTRGYAKGGTLSSLSATCLRPFRRRRAAVSTEMYTLPQRVIRFKKELDRSEWFMYPHILGSSNFSLIRAATQVARPANPKATNLFRASGQVYNAAERRGEIPKS